MRAAGVVRCEEDNIFRLLFKHSILKPLRHMCINIILLIWRMFEQLHLCGGEGEAKGRHEAVRSTFVVQ